MALVHHLGNKLHHYWRLYKLGDCAVAIDHCRFSGYLWRAREEFFRPDPTSPTLKTLKYQNAISKKESIVDASGKGTAAKLTSWTQDCTKVGRREGCRVAEPRVRARACAPGALQQHEQAVQELNSGKNIILAKFDSIVFAT